MFYSREHELEKLQLKYDADKFECIVIYGRRRIGKTALINEFCKDKPTIFFSALNSSNQENLETLSQVIYRYKEPHGIGYPSYQSYQDALEEVTKLSSHQRLIMVIDEYPYLAKAEPSISSRLQHIIDHVWQQGKLFLILCGSSMSFMQNQVLGYESPLYGRRTAQFKIQALNYKEVSKFNPNLSTEDKALLYGVTGGVPHYINKLQVENSIDSALLSHFFNSAAYLYEEPENLLKQELREPTIYNSIITAIANGASRSNEISSKVGLESGVCAKYLKVLTELGILKKEIPITEKTGKKTIYHIGDNFFRFWYRFIPKNNSAIQAERFTALYDIAVKKHLYDYMGLIFEQMCREYLLYYAVDLPIMISEIGQWWGSNAKTKKEVQIDIVATPLEGNEYIVGSCKYKNKVVGIEELYLLQEYAQVFGKGGLYHYYIFSKSGFTKELLEVAQEKKIFLVTLDDLYKIS